MQTHLTMRRSPAQKPLHLLARNHRHPPIYAGDFRRLRNRLVDSSLAFAEKDDRLKHNTSVVLLLEWRGRRLLFTADAEWTGKGVAEGRRNSTWDVMLHIPEVERVLRRPLGLLKVAHHGSHNGTPFGENGREQVLEKIVVPDRTHVVVSMVTGKHGEKNLSHTLH
jgi:hypothetical protein